MLTGQKHFIGLVAKPYRDIVRYTAFVPQKTLLVHMTNIVKVNIHVDELNCVSNPILKTEHFPMIRNVNIECESPLAHSISNHFDTYKHTI